MSYEEKRVRVKDFGSMPGDSPLLVQVPGVGGKARRLHKIAAASFQELAAAIAKDLQIELQIASGWRKHRWESKQQYEQVLVKKYGSVREGRKWLAYASPHETGLAMDIGVGGLTPNRKTRDKQRQTPLHQWMVENADRFGWHPYKNEPWHWEHYIGRGAWETGDPEAEDMVSFAPGQEDPEDIHDTMDAEICEDDIDEGVE
ncbi:MAG: D-alanyl-D-alanine carboxypeptidase family protein [Myxococcales bacterium]|nr:D-alanyl-D-alanine carboxypeptidase family protein [Myxococcales bacterium]